MSKELHNCLQDIPGPREFMQPSGKTTFNLASLGCLRISMEDVRVQDFI